MTTTQAVLGFAAVAALLTIIPGLDTTLVVRSALINGRRQACATGLGIMTGLLVWGAAAAAGAAALLSASELAYRAVTLAGAGYLVYLGARMIVRSTRTQASVSGQDGAPAPPSTWRCFAAGTWTNVLNPKIGVFYIATIPQFIPPDTSPLGIGLTLAGVHALITLLWFALIIAAANAARRFLRHNGALSTIDRIAGSLMIGFGIKLVA